MNDYFARFTRLYFDMEIDKQVAILNLRTYNHDDVCTSSEKHITV